MSQSAYVQGSIPLPVGPDAPAAAPTSTESGPFGRSLRIALAMKGGVSLAVWIGGAVAELDVLRAIRLTGSKENPGAVLLATWAEGGDPTVIHRDVTRRATVYAKLLISRRYDRVEFDILAGASAGGLNAVMYGVAQRIGASTEMILTVWKESGDIWKLLRKGGRNGIDSVLGGDDYFWGKLLDALRELHDQPRHPDLVAPVSVDLSATIVDSNDSTERGVKEGKGHFHFAGGIAPDVSGRLIPDGSYPTLERDIALSRLAYAARTTSSFPGAFEAARIYSGVEPAPDGAVDMREAFNAHRQIVPSDETVDGQLATPAPDPFRVVDGGVTDNVPIDRALRAVRTRRADQYVNRALVYLDPSPRLEFDGLVRPTAYRGTPPSLAEDPTPSTTADPRSGFLSVIFTAIGRMIGRESKDDEVEDVDRFRRLLYLDQARDELFAPITEQPYPYPGAGLPEQLARAFARFRSGADIDLLTDVLIQPSVWQLTTLNPRMAFRGWRREDLVRLDSTLINRFREANPAEVEGICTGHQGAVDASRCMIAWTRAIEDCAFPSTGGIAQLDGDVWPNSGATSDRETFRERLYEAHAASVLDRDNALAEVLVAAEALQGDEIDPTALAEAISEAWLLHANSPGTEARWNELNGLVADLRHVSVAMTLSDVEGAPYATAWSQSPWQGIGQTLPEFVARDLAPLVGARGIPMEMRAIKYEDITAAERTAEPAAYATLMHAQMISGYRSLTRLKMGDASGLSLVDGQVQDTVRQLMPIDNLKPQTKLAGIGLGNFAGFLSADWRSNDWWWGRMDAAHGVVDLLEQLTVPVPGSPLETGLKPAVEGALLDQWRRSTDNDVQTTPAVDVQLRLEFQSSIGNTIGGLSALSPSYKVAVASRLIRLISRASVRGAPAPQRLLHWILRPVLVIVPAAFAPARLAVIAAIIAGSVILFVPPQPATAASREIVVALSIGLLLMFGIYFWNRWRRKRELDEALDAPRLGYVSAAIARGRNEGLALGVASVSFAALATILIFVSGLAGPLTWVLLGAALVASLVSRTRLFIPRIAGGRKPVGSIAGFATAAAIIAASVWLHDAVMPSPDWRNPWGIAGMVALTGIVYSAVLTAGWLSGFAPEQNSVARGKGLIVLVLTCLLSGVAAGAVFLIPLVISSAPDVILAVISFWAWGTVLWWVPAVWQPAYAPSDRPGSRRVPPVGPSAL